MLLSSLCLFFLPIASAAAGSNALKCLPSGDERQINEAFLKGGKGTTVTLCKNSVHRLKNPVVFTAARQTLTTEGNPTGRERALLIVEGEEQSAAIQADCKQCNAVTVRSLEVNGNRPLMLRIPSGGAMLQMGNSEGQIVRDCRLYEPRGWSALHFREGDDMQCRKAHVFGNEIGPCGEERDDEYDGTIDQTLPWGKPWADGISVACKESLIEKNVVYDTTDAAIVLFTAVGTEVRHNEIFSKTRVMLGGINMVDSDPWDGDYSDVLIHHNDIYALARYMKIGIAVGKTTWFDDVDAIIHSGTIVDNTLHGPHFGYGIVISSATDFTILRNMIADDAAFSSVEGPRCPQAPKNHYSTPFLIHRSSSTGTFQDEFVNGEVEFIICVNPPPVGGVPWKAWRFRDSPIAIEARKAAEEAENPQANKAPLDTRVTEALVSYQMNILKAMDGLTNQVEQGLTVRDNSEPLPDSGVDAAVDDFGDTAVGSGDSTAARLSKLEQREKHLESMVAGLKVELERMNIFTNDSMRARQKDLQGLFNELALLRPGATPEERKANAGRPVVGDAEEDHSYKPPPSRDGGYVRQERPVVVSEAEDEDEEDDAGETSWLGPLSVVAGAASLLWIAMSVLRRWRKTSGSVKKGAKIF